MQFEKKFLTELNRCYATGQIEYNGERLALLATEGEGACFAYAAPGYDQQRIVWSAPGGTMSFVPLSGTNGEFLSNQKFFRMFQWEEATIVWVRPQPDGTFAVKELFTLPYIHRFDVLTAADGRQFFVGCTLATKKETKEDWSSPGKIYVAELPADLNQPVNLTVLKDGLTQNHGYSRVNWKGREASMVGAREGAFIVTPPAAAGQDWTIEQIMDWPVSDLAAIDLDGDGELEIATIEAFHGQYYRIYKLRDGRYERIYEHPEVSEFYHVVVSATLIGRPAFIGGCRRGKLQLFCVTATGDQGSRAVESGTAGTGSGVGAAAGDEAASELALETTLIDEGVGPSNVSVINESGRDVIVSANREKGEAALYFVTE
ncbi:MAG: hypothetical protein EOM08_03450 [Clostridia bacterium]|nr:hypothetical protein [Clostridia bacterium]NCC75473.1 hypothetical protein [Clostridia bacterium]